MKKYINISTIMLAFSLHNEEPGKKPIDYIIQPNDEAMLPSSSEYVQRLVKQRYLQEVPETKPAAEPKSTAPNTVTNSKDK